MATVPGPRDGGGPALPGVSGTEWRLLEAIREVGQDVREMRGDFTARFDQLPARFVPRPEVEQFMRSSERDRADLHAALSTNVAKADADLAAAQAKHNADTLRLEEAIKAQERERQAAQRWALGLLATLLVAIAGLGVTLFVNLH